MHGNKTNKRNLQPHSYVSDATRPRRVWGVKRITVWYKYIDLTHIYITNLPREKFRKKERKKKRKKGRKKEKRKAEKKYMC